MQDNTERQKIYREKLYNAGFKPMRIWVKRKEAKEAKMNMPEFIKKLKKLTTGLEAEKLSSLFNLFIKITKARKEEDKLRARK